MIVFLRKDIAFQETKLQLILVLNTALEKVFKFYVMFYIVA
jgi:hypothetical protein